MTQSLPPTDTYCIAFETKDPETGKSHAGYLKAVQVTIKHEVMDTTDTARVDLADHPLYKYLENYVHANPSAPRKKKRG